MQPQNVVWIFGTKDVIAVVNSNYVLWVLLHLSVRYNVNAIVVVVVSAYK